MRESLNERVALVTGASSGIGRATALEFASEGANVVVAARREERLEELAVKIETEYDVDALVVPTDVTDEEQVNRMVEAAVEEFGQLEIVVNNAGVGHGNAIEELSTEMYRNVMGSNVDGAFFTSRAAIPHLRESQGTLIFIGSIAGRFPTSIYPVYAAAKWWTRGFALSLAGHIGEDDIAVTVVNPTGIRTEFGSEYRDPNEEIFEEGDWPSPEDVAGAIVFAAKQDSPTAIGELDVYRRSEFSD